MFTVCYNRSGSARVVWCSSIKQSKADINGVCVCLLQCVFAMLCVCVHDTCVLECMHMCVCAHICVFQCEGLLIRVGAVFVMTSVDVCPSLHAV